MHNSFRQDVEFQLSIFAWLSYLATWLVRPFTFVTPGNLIHLRVHSDECFSGDEKKASIFPDVYNFRLMGHNCDIVANGIDTRVDEDLIILAHDFSSNDFPVLQ